MRVGGKKGLEFCCSCERALGQRTRDDVDRVWFRSPPEFSASPLSAGPDHLFQKRQVPKCGGDQIVVDNGHGVSVVHSGVGESRRLGGG